jgi:hypothetical protein
MHTQKSGSSLFFVGICGCFWLVLQSLSFWLDPKGPKTQGFLKMVKNRMPFSSEETRAFYGLGLTKVLQPQPIWY